MSRRPPKLPPTAHADWVSELAAQHADNPAWKALCAKAAAAHNALDTLRAQYKATEQSITSVSRERDHALNGWKSTQSGQQAHVDHHNASWKLRDARDDVTESMSRLNNSEKDVPHRWLLQSTLDTTGLPDQRSWWTKTLDNFRGYPTWHKARLDLTSRLGTARTRLEQAETQAAAADAALSDIEKNWSASHRDQRSSSSTILAGLLNTLQRTQTAQTQAEQKWDEIQRVAVQMAVPKPSNKVKTKPAKSVAPASSSRTRRSSDSSSSTSSSSSSTDMTPVWMLALLNTPTAHAHVAETHAAEHGFSSSGGFGGDGYHSSGSDHSSHSSHDSSSSSSHDSSSSHSSCSSSSSSCSSGSSCGSS